jgi:hypothetical protein
MSIPPAHQLLVVEPENTVDGAANLQQVNVTGYRLQTTDAEQIRSISVLLPDRPEALHGRVKQSDQSIAQNLAYREETNFAKIDRIDPCRLEAFKSRVLAVGVQDEAVWQWNRTWLCAAHLDHRARPQRTMAGISYEVEHLLHRSSNLDAVFTRCIGPPPMSLPQAVPPKCQTRQATKAPPRSISPLAERLDAAL